MSEDTNLYFKDSLDAMLYIEQDADDEDKYIAAFQYLIDSGIVWSLQGFYGRHARYLIDVGMCTSGTSGTSGKDK